MSEDRGPLELPGIPGSGEEPLSGIPGADAYGSATVHPDTGSEPKLATGEAAALPGDPADAPVPHHGRYIAELVAAILIALFMAFALLGFVVEATSSHIAHNNTSRGSQVGAAIFSVVILLLALAWAWRAEHRLRHARGHPVARAFQTSATSPPSTAVRRALYRQRHHYGPGVGIFMIALLGLFAFGMLGNGISKISDASRTSYVQHHGVLSAATVQSVNNDETCGRGGCTYTAEITVALVNPVEGTTTSVVHYPDYSNLSDGDQVQVLVDPKQPGYAELPGHPDVQTVDWIVSFVVGALFLAFFAVIVREVVRSRRKARKHAADALAAAA